MGLICKYGGRECDGCGACQNHESVCCPICGEELSFGDKVYKVDQEVVGCEHCCTAVPADDLI